MGATITLGVSGWRLKAERTGVRRYLFNLISRWTPEMVQSRFSGVTVYSPRATQRGETAFPPGIGERVLRSELAMIPWENLRVGPVARESVMLYPSYSRPLVARGATVVVTHDATMRLYPELFTKRDRRVYDPLYGWSARAATLVITTTYAARADISAQWGVDPSKIHVTHLAADESFGPLPLSTDRNALRLRLTGFDEPYFLFAGKISGRRNLPRLLDALAEFRRSSSHPHRLVMVGPPQATRELELMAENLGIRQHVVTRGFASDVELNQLYNCADAFVMPSTYETVSFPIMEAQAAGTPVICVDTPGSREMTGGEAVLIPRLDVRDLVAAMASIASDSAFRASIAERGMANCRRFSWARCAAETLDICAEAGRMSGVSNRRP